jgi:hypothetical protein
MKWPHPMQGRAMPCNAIVLAFQHKHFLIHEQIGWYKSPCAIPLSRLAMRWEPPILCHMTFGLCSIWSHFSIRFFQVHNDFCVDNSVRSSFYECHSWCDRGQSFDIFFFARSRISRLLPTLRKVTDRTCCVSEPCRNGRHGFAPGRRMSRTMRDSESLLTRTFAMLFYLSCKRIHTLHFEISTKLSSLQKYNSPIPGLPGTGVLSSSLDSAPVLTARKSP